MLSRGKYIWRHSHSSLPLFLPSVPSSLLHIIQTVTGELILPRFPSLLPSSAPLTTPRCILH